MTPTYRVGSWVIGLLIIGVGMLSAFGQPLAGLLYEYRVVFLGVYAARESWIVVALAVLLLMSAKTIKDRDDSYLGIFPLIVYMSIVVFALLVLLSERTPSGMILFLQFRNLFGFVLFILFVKYFEERFDVPQLRAALWVVAVGVIGYAALEVLMLLQDGKLLSNEVFNKRLLEEAKGTRADVGGGIIARFRIPGSLFNPSQLGMFAVYLILAGRQKEKVFGFWMTSMLLIVVLIGFSKSAFVMVFMWLLLTMLGRQFALVALLVFMSAPLLLTLMEGVLPAYHYASIARHFEGYTSSIHLLAESPFGTGIGSAGELASTLGGFEAAAGYESGLGTYFTNMGVFGAVIYLSLCAYCFLQANRVYFDLFALWSVGMYFNESALSPHLFVFSGCIAVALSLKNRSTIGCSESARPTRMVTA